MKTSRIVLLGVLCVIVCVAVGVLLEEYIPKTVAVAAIITALASGLFFFLGLSSRKK